MKRHTIKTESNFSPLEILGLVLAAIVMIAAGIILAHLPAQANETKVCGKNGNADYYCYTVKNKPM